jgi:hypothetical protein
MSTTHLCPRREETLGRSFPGLPDSDTWNDRDGYPVCSYCGSLNPDRFMECVEAGVELGPTDKNYKVYIDLPDPKAGELKITGSSNGEKSPGPSWTRATAQDLVEYYGGAERVPHDTHIKWVHRTTRQTVHGKFYFMHLSDGHRTRFVELMNSGKLSLGFPGRFYVLPYFVVVRA